MIHVSKESDKTSEFKRTKNWLCWKIWHESDQYTSIVFFNSGNTSFGIHSRQSELISVVSQLRNLRKFRLHDTGGSIDINPIGELKQLTVLSLDLVQAKNNFDFLSIVDRLVNLMKLTFIVNKFKISEQTYVRLVEIVDLRLEARNRVLEISCPRAKDFNDLV